MHTLGWFEATVWYRSSDGLKCFAFRIYEKSIVEANNTIRTMVDGKDLISFSSSTLGITIRASAIEEIIVRREAK